MLILLGILLLALKANSLFFQAYFSHPMVAAAVIIHLAADGTTYIDQTQCNITVQLVDTKEGIHSLGTNKRDVLSSCWSSVFLGFFLEQLAADASCSRTSYVVIQKGS